MKESHRPADRPAVVRPGAGPPSFFDRQSRARRLTAVMVVAFGLCLPAMLVLEYQLFKVFQFGPTLSHNSSLKVSYSSFGVSREAALWVCAVTGLLIAFEAGRRWVQFAGGGASVAVLMGGRWISSATDRREERRLLNVVEEMAVAAGVPAPSVFVLDREGGINAFVAGTRRDRAAIVVTRGALDYLTRDELQALVAHEMSHVFNQDMALNLRLAGVVAGMLAVHRFTSLVARVIGTPWYRPADPPFGSGSVVGAGGHFWLAFVMAIPDFVLVRAPMIAGALGVLTARCLQAAVNRSREELADASAVQFTRDPAALAGVLKKIGGLPKGGAIDHELAPQLCHMFFDAPLTASARPLPSHPPLAGRIRKLDPLFTGGYIPPRPLAPEFDTLYDLGHAALNDPMAPEPIPQYRRRAQDLVRRARRLKARAGSAEDPEIRSELERLEETRRDLWVDAGQVVRESMAWTNGALSEGVVPSTDSAPASRPWLKRVLSAPEGWRLTAFGFFYLRIALPLVVLLLFASFVKWCIGPAKVIDPRLVGAWTSPHSEVTYDLRPDGSFSYRPAAGHGVPVEGRWRATSSGERSPSVTSPERLMLHLRSDSDWTIDTQVFAVTLDTITLCLPASVKPMTLNDLVRLKPLTYRRGQHLSRHEDSPGPRRPNSLLRSR